MRVHRGRLLLASVAAIAIVATGAHASTGAAKPVNVTLAGWSSGPDEDTLLEQVVARFNQTHPTVHANLSFINTDYTQSMEKRFAAHDPPDVFYVDSSVAPVWEAQGVLEPLNAYVAKSKYDTTKFFPSVLDAFTDGNQIYGFPKDWSPLAMVVDTAMLGQIHAMQPRNWTELVSVAQKMAAQGVVPNGKPICVGADWARMLAFVYQNQGSLTNVQSSAVKGAVDFYVGLYKKGLAATPDELGVSSCDEAFGQQKAAIVFQGNWLLPLLSSTYPGVKYSVFPMIRQVTGGNLAFTVSYSMAKDAKNKDAAWTLLSWLTSREGQTLWTSKGLALPTRTDVKVTGPRQNFMVAAPFAQVWAFPNFTKTYTVMNDDLNAVIAGSKTVPQMLADVASSLKK
jgi:multiple sugar transport system substrate-binding protein